MPNEDEGKIEGETPAPIITTDETKTETVPTEEVKESEEVKVEEVIAPVSNESAVDFSELDALIEAISKGGEKKEEETKPTEPVNFPKEEENKVVAEDEEDTITAEQLEQLDKEFDELEAKLSEKEVELESTKKERDEAKDISTKLEQAIDKIGDHPILGPLVEAFFDGKELNFPDYLKKYVDEELASIPQIDNVNQISVPTAPEDTFQERLEKRAKNLH